jgi:cytochrome bd ubiquinol oxidase subunit II
MLDYNLLKVIWWLLLGVLLIAFAVSDGFDLGVAILHPFIAKTEIEKRILINSIGPVWEGNQVWLVVVGGVIFAAWPLVYAVAFSGLYLAMLIVLSALIVRPVAFKFRSKIDNVLWRKTWDGLLFIGGVVPALIFGVALGNVVQGIPFHYDASMRIYYTGSFFSLLNPFALLAGCTSVAMLVTHGGLYLAIKTTEPLSTRAAAVSRVASIITLFLFLVGLSWVVFGMQAYILQSEPTYLSTPLHKTVTTAVGAWGKSFYHYPLFMLAPISAIVGAILVGLLTPRWLKAAFLANSAMISGIIATIGFSLFPFILPSSSHPNHSLLVWDAAASQLTLFVMLLVTIVFLPLILCYTAWVYRVLRGKVTAQVIQDTNAY